MRGSVCRLLRLVGALPILLVGSGRAQPLPPPPVFLPPELPAPFAPDDAEGAKLCVPRYGHAGCAAHLYAELLCAVVGETNPSLDLQSELDRQFREAGIEFDGLAAAQIEREAVQEQAPQICPHKSAQIFDLFNALSRSPAP